MRTRPRRHTRPSRRRTRRPPATGGASRPPPATAPRWPRPAQPRRSPRRRTRAALIASGALAGAAALVIGGAILGPKLVPSLRGDTQFVPPPGADPPAAPAGGTSDTPKLTMGQPFGDGVTGFQIHGSGFAPATSVAITLHRARNDAAGGRADGRPQRNLQFHGRPGTPLLSAPHPGRALPRPGPGLEREAAGQDRVQGRCRAYRPAAAHGPPPSGPPPSGNAPPPQGLGAPPGHGAAHGALTF